MVELYDGGWAAVQASTQFQGSNSSHELAAYQTKPYSADDVLQTTPMCICWSKLIKLNETLNKLNKQSNPSQFADNVCDQ
jgi:hypothetical protein